MVVVTQRKFKKYHIIIIMVTREMFFVFRKFETEKAEIYYDDDTQLHIYIQSILNIFFFRCWPKIL